MPGRRGIAHGGVAILFRESACNFKKIPIQNPRNYEVLPAVGSVRGFSSELVLVACYIPPNYPLSKAKATLEYINDVVVEAKRRYLTLSSALLGTSTNGRLAKHLKTTSTYLK